MSTLAETVPRSYCVVCDAEPGQCSHSAGRYLEEIVYERVPGEGWAVPEHERERWENPPKLAAPSRPQEQPKPIQQLVVELEAWIDLGVELERKLREVYEREPLRVTRAANSVIEATQAGRLTSPGGLLMKRLRELA